MCTDHDWVLGVPVWYLPRALKAEAWIASRGQTSAIRQPVGAGPGRVNRVALVRMDGTEFLNGSKPQHPTCLLIPELTVLMGSHRKAFSFLIQDGIQIIHLDRNLFAQSGTLGKS